MLNTRIECTEHTVAVPRLPEALRGLRVVQLSDLHRSQHTSDRVLHHAVSLANAAEPDLVILTGDFVTKDPADIGPCAHILAPLCARLGVYAILGNHDYTADGPAMAHALTQQGITMLTNRSVRLEHGLTLVGLDDDRCGRPNLPRAFDHVGPEDPTLVLCHNPAVAERVADRACIVFAGHTHGGQVRVPVLTPWKVRGIGAKHYRAGWFTVGNAKLYVHRGLGQVGLPFRFRCRPEVAVFTLEPAP